MQSVIKRKAELPHQPSPTENKRKYLKPKTVVEWHKSARWIAPWVQYRKTNKILILI